MKRDSPFDTMELTTTPFERRISCGYYYITKLQKFHS
jgi:hypothetical protein